MEDNYSIEDLHHDIWVLYRAGFIEPNMREDGEWIFSMSEKAKSMSEEEIKQLIDSLGEYDIEDTDGNL